MATIRQWIAWVEQRVADVVVGEGLHVGLVGVTQGPHVVTFRLRLIRPDRAGLQRLLSLGPVFAQALHVDRVRVVDSEKGVLVEIPSPQPKTPKASDLARHTQGLRVAVGIDQWRRPVAVNLADHPVVMWVGPSGKGKTSAMKATLFALAARNSPRRLRFVVFAQKVADWEAFADLAGCLAVVTDPREVEEALTWAASTLLPYRTRERVAKPAVVFVVDDLVNLLAKSPGIVGPMIELASQGRAAGLYTFLSTQQAGSKTGTGSTVIEDNATARIVFRASSATSGARAAGAGRLGVEQLSGAKGDALLIVDDQVTRIATGFADDRAVVLLPSGEGSLRPWANRSNPAIERPRTAQNAQNGAVPTPMAAHAVNVDDGGRMERNGTPATVAPGEPEAVENDTKWHEMAQENEDRIPGNRPPTIDERRRLRELYRELGSKEKVYFAAWGFKNGRVAEYLRQALEEGD